MKNEIPAMQKSISQLLNGDLTLLSYELYDITDLSLQLINDKSQMRLCIRMNIPEKTAKIILMSGIDLDEEEFVLIDKINY